MKNLIVTLLHTLKPAVAALLLLPLSIQGASLDSTIGVVVMHGKWGSPKQHVNVLADALQNQGFLVANPEMPWSRRRSYDKGVEGADAEIDAEIAKLRSLGATQIFLAGHSLGAAFALHYAARTSVSGIIAIAPGHRPEGKVFVDMLAGDVKKARELVASQKGDELVSFIHRETGNRRESLKAGATVFLSYFDPAGPMNMTRNVTLVKPGTPVFWIVPTREEQPARGFVVAYFDKLPPNPGNKFFEPDSDHLNAPPAAALQTIDWIRTTAARNQGTPAFSSSAMSWASHDVHPPHSAVLPITAAHSSAMRFSSSLIAYGLPTLMTDLLNTSM